jgi:very-short-patch-repair endonuclease
MHLYNHTLKPRARHLRTTMTDSERRLWERLRRKQLLSVQVYRQKPIGPYIVDFYVPQVGLIIEIDGSQHLDDMHVTQDAQRNTYLQRQGLQVLRFHTTDVLQKLDEVVEVIFRVMEERMGGRKARKIPPSPPLSKGGT